MNQQTAGAGNINAAHLVASKQKRLRHLTCLNAKNLKINAPRFNVWFTLHLNDACKAFFVSEKKEHDRNPKWNLKDSLSKYSFKQFVVRVWYTSLEELNVKRPIAAAAAAANDHLRRLNLLLEMHVDMDCLAPLSDASLQAVSKSVKSYPNYLVFEVFGSNFAEPFVDMTPKKRNNTLSAAKYLQLQQQQSLSTLAKISAKKSYSLNSMIRIQDFQRVIQETQAKIVQLKANSLNKFGQLGRLRQMQLRREESLQRIRTYRESLSTLERSILKLVHENAEAEERKRALAEKLQTFDVTVYQVERKRYFQLEKIFAFTAKALSLVQAQLKWRQKELVIELADVFTIENFVDSKRSQLDLLTSLPLNFNRQQPSGKLKLLNASLVINRGIVYTSAKNVNPANPAAATSATMTEVADDDENAISLGYVVHALQLLADILCVPLKYPLLFRSSKSYVVEQLSDFDSRKLPLFKNAASDDVYFYAVGLLNIDITQLKVFADKRFLGIIESTAPTATNNVDILLNLKSIFEYFKRVSK